MVDSQSKTSVQLLREELEALRHRYQARHEHIELEADLQRMVLMEQAKQVLPPEGTWMSIKQAADKHKLHPYTVRRWVDYGWVRVHPDSQDIVRGRACMIDEHDVVKVILERPTKMGPEPKSKN